MEQRRFHRVTCSIPGELIHHGITYHIRLQNISLRGALIGSHECLMVPIGDSCTLSVLLADGDPPSVITAEVVHSFFSMVGVKFTGFEDGAEEHLFHLMRKITPEPEKLKKEWERILSHQPGSVAVMP